MLRVLAARVPVKASVTLLHHESQFRGNTFVRIASFFFLLAAGHEKLLDWAEATAPMYLHGSYNPFDHDRLSNSKSDSIPYICISLQKGNVCRGQNQARNCMKHLPKTRYSPKPLQTGKIWGHHWLFSLTASSLALSSCRGYISIAFIPVCRDASTQVFQVAICSLSPLPLRKRLAQKNFPMVG